MRTLNKIVLLNAIILFLVIILNVFIAFEEKTNLLSVRIIYYLIQMILLAVFLIKEKFLFIVIGFNFLFWATYLIIRILVLDKMYISYFNHPIIEYTCSFVDYFKIKGLFSKIIIAIPILINFLISFYLIKFLLIRKRKDNVQN